MATRSATRSILSPIASVVRHSSTSSGSVSVKSRAPAKTAETAVLGNTVRPSDVALPRPPPHVPDTQAPNRVGRWSKGQNPVDNAMRGPRFEQTSMQYQPRPLAAIELIADEPIRLVSTRIASCDGGGGPLGHPRIFINVDKPGPKACGYCGLRFERAVDPHHHH